MPRKRLELLLYYYNWILNPTRLPIPPPRLIKIYFPVRLSLICYYITFQAQNKYYSLNLKIKYSRASPSSNFSFSMFSVLNNFLPPPPGVGANYLILPFYFVSRAGFEPATYGLEGCCSIQLSYRDIITLYQSFDKKSIQIIFG